MSKCAFRIMAMLAPSARRTSTGFRTGWNGEGCGPGFSSTASSTMTIPFRTPGLLSERTMTFPERPLPPVSPKSSKPSTLESGGRPRLLVPTYSPGGITRLATPFMRLEQSRRLWLSRRRRLSCSRTPSQTQLAGSTLIFVLLLAFTGQPFCDEMARLEHPIHWMRD